MDLLNNLVNGVVTAGVGLVVWLAIRGRLEAIEERITRLEDNVNGRITRLEDSVNGRIDSLRSDLTQVALAVGARPPAEAGG